VHPIGVGETARRIIGKAIAVTITEDIQEAAGPLQVCAGHISGCEAAVHAMSQVLNPNKQKQSFLSMHQTPLTYLTVRQLSTAFRSYSHISQKSSSTPTERIPNSL